MMSSLSSPAISVLSIEGKTQLTSLIKKMGHNIQAGLQFPPSKVVRDPV